MNILLEGFGASIDWVVIALLAIVFTILIVFLALFIYFVVKNPKPEEDANLTIEQNKTQKYLDKQNNIAIKRCHARCKVCGARINKLNGKCSVCGTKNFDDEDNILHKKI